MVEHEVCRVVANEQNALRVLTFCSKVEDNASLNESCQQQAYKQEASKIVHELEKASSVADGTQQEEHQRRLCGRQHEYSPQQVDGAEPTVIGDGIEEILRHQHGEVGYHDHHGIMVHEVVRRFIVELLQAQIYQQVEQQEVADDDGDPDQVISMVSVFFHTNL